MDHGDLNYLHEQAREEREGFPLCRCSNCAPDEAKILKAQMKEMNLSNFDSILDQTLLPGQIPDEEPKKKTTRSRRPKPKKLSLLMQKLSSTLVSSFNKFFADVYGKPRSFLPQQIFGLTEANAIATNFDKVKNKSDIAKLIGGEALEGELDMLDVSIENFKQGDDYQAYLKETKTNGPCRIAIKCYYNFTTERPSPANRIGAIKLESSHTTTSKNASDQTKTKRKPSCQE
ncbi:ATP-dependent DNA helicase sgs1 [Puccinia graminis f. sp. tritici]|uniref:ATP-dependent DNA helicase sgs1 n=1 Tax=Puccinia graminis f. sp. tritici TaxID=56615 RepID=A0A5B0M9F7_PUCGR|nr:ATP-dependent DNA helicase sgs1 [Puccinia graminis f. sp. tritici]